MASWHNFDLYYKLFRIVEYLLCKYVKKIDSYFPATTTDLASSPTDLFQIENEN